LLIVSIYQDQLNFKIPSGSLTSNNKLNTRKIPMQIRRETNIRKNQFFILLALRIIRVAKKVQIKNPAFSTNNPKRKRAPKIKPVLIVKKGAICGLILGELLTEVIMITRDRAKMIIPARNGKKPGPGLFDFPIPSRIAP